jgi:hypothetical protein
MSVLATPSSRLCISYLPRGGEVEICGRDANADFGCGRGITGGIPPPGSGFALATLPAKGREETNA